MWLCVILYIGISISKGLDASIFSVVEMVSIFWRNLLSPFYLEDGDISHQDPWEEGEKLEPKPIGSVIVKAKNEPLLVPQ
jgi:hypothetical protein